jgi:RNA polymerase sigma factor (TIGR02999 family)
MQRELYNLKRSLLRHQNYMGLPAPPLPRPVGLSHKALEGSGAPLRRRAKHSSRLLCAEQKAERAQDFRDLLFGLAHQQDSVDMSSELHARLLAIAGALVWQERSDLQWEPPALVHEGCLRLCDRPLHLWKSEPHFLGAATKAMRRILIEHARARNAVKRGGGWTRLDLDEIRLSAPELRVDVLDLRRNLDRLRAIDCKKAQVIALRFFEGLTIHETAIRLGVSDYTVKREWALAREWLKQRINASEAQPAPAKKNLQG